MKKMITMILMFLILCGCNGKQTEVKILIPDGIPTIALGGLFDEANIKADVVAGADLLSSELLQNNYDLIVAPITLGATLYLKGKTSYRLDSIITFGNTYLVSEKKLDSLQDLEGKTIGAYGLNNIPDMILQLALEKANVQAQIEYENSVNDVVSNRFVNKALDYILCAEPVLTNLEVKKQYHLNIINLQDVLKDEITFIPQAAIFVKDGVKQSILNKIKNNIENLNANPDSYVKKLMTLDQDKYPTFNKLGEDIITRSIPRSNIGFVKASDNQEDINKFFTLLNNYNPNLFNNQMPDEGFYVKK
jgi:NitT/TauT family transport system substrate-binding protein